MLVAFDVGKPAGNPLPGQGFCEYGYQSTDPLMQQTLAKFSDSSQIFHRKSDRALWG
ncbi:MAG: hypothetical protein K0Q83_1951 [Deltaproteobacteria bacterium]|jgi:hypothetical protein|nr:hypothetical protein [Deltaproteobacteria bacterium]